MGSTEQVQFHYKENGGTRELVITGFKVKQDEVMIGTSFENADFKADPLDHPFGRVGLNYTISEIEAWAATNGFDLFVQGADTQGPYILTVAINGGKTVVTISFNSNVDKTGLAAALKAAITVATDGETFAALGGSDAVGTVDGSSDEMTVTFNSALSTATNVIKIAAGALVDASGNQNKELVTSVIDAS